MLKITSHTIVKNEDQFIWYALMSVLPQVSQILIYDTGSTDQTVKIIKSLKSPKIVFEEKGRVSPGDIASLRLEQIKRTKTDFFMLLDGDEIWPKRSLEKLLESPKHMLPTQVAVYCRTRNAVGDVYHYQPESAGRYEFAGRRGNYTMRMFHNLPGISVSGIYPLEQYSYQGRPLNDWDEKLFFSDTWYLHATHLRRSSNRDRVPGNRLVKVETGLALNRSEIPEVFSSNPPPRRSKLYEISAMILTPLKELKRAYA